MPDDAQQMTTREALRLAARSFGESFTTDDIVSGVSLHVPNVKRNTIMVTLHHETKLGVFERTGIGIYRRGRNFDSVAHGQAALLDEPEPRKSNLAGLD